MWRAATAAAERLWTTEYALGCPESVCTGITAAAAAAGVTLPKTTYWLTESMVEGADRMSDQLCRMSQLGIRTGPTDPGFCPSDEVNEAVAATAEVELRQRLEEEVAALRVELARLKGGDSTE